MRDDLSVARADATKVAKYHAAQLRSMEFKIEDRDRKIENRDREIEDLKREKERLRRQIESSPGWAPGGSGQNPAATGG